MDGITMDGITMDGITMDGIQAAISLMKAFILSACLAGMAAFGALALNESV